MAKIDVFRAARRYCLTCQGESPAGVRACADEACPLWPWRLPTPPDDADSTPAAASGKRAPAPAGTDTVPAPYFADAADATRATGGGYVPFVPSARRTALRRRLLRVIRRQCLACAGHRTDVRQCAARDCALWHLRFGVMPETYRAVRNRFFAPKPLSLF